MRSRRKRRRMNRWMVVVVMKTCGYWIEWFPILYCFGDYVLNIGI